MLTDNNESPMMMEKRGELDARELTK